jgi:hypothetical protein
MGGRPTVRQVYALAGALCERAGEEFPETFGAASELIERLRIENGHPAPRLSDTPSENGHPAPRLSDTPFRPRRRRRRGVGRTGLGAHYWRASEVAAELVREMR